MSDEDLTIVCMDAMKKMTDRQLAWIIKHGTGYLHDRLYYLKKKIEKEDEVTA
tara:strand:+ start:1868 stop:2026 length:159 start_codon:yes stop_codon:yes gene_type:complete